MPHENHMRGGSVTAFPLLEAKTLKGKKPMRVSVF